MREINVFFVCGTELNSEIDGVMLRTLHSEAVNESPILRGKVVCVCVCADTGVSLASRRCQTGSQPCVCGEIR